MADGRRALAAGPDVRDFIARAKARPETVSFASAGIGTTPHLAAESMLKQAGLTLLHVPYKGNGAAMTDVMAGRVTMILDGVGSVAAKVRGGQLRARGVTSTQRLASFPEISTIAEQGLAGFSSYVYFGLFAPKATPKPVVQDIWTAKEKAIDTPELLSRFREDGMDPVSMSPQAFDESLKRELGDMAKLVSELGIAKE